MRWFNLRITKIASQNTAINIQSFFLFIKINKLLICSLGTIAMTFAKQNMFLDQHLLFSSGPKVEIEVVIMTFNDILSRNYNKKSKLCFFVAEMGFQ